MKEFYLATVVMESDNLEKSIDNIDVFIQRNNDNVKLMWLKTITIKNKIVFRVRINNNVSRMLYNLQVWCSPVSINCHLVTCDK